MLQNEADVILFWVPCNATIKLALSHSALMLYKGFLEGYQSNDK